MPLATLKQVLLGVWKANKEVLDPEGNLREVAASVPAATPGEN